MSRKIIGITVGTPMNPEKVVKKAGVALPVVTEDDNGKVLQVEGGEWAKQPIKTETLNIAKNTAIDKLFK
jgi:hypothetical protein